VEVNRKSKNGGNFIVFSYTINDASFDFPVQDWFKFPENLNPATWDRTTPLNEKGSTEYDINQNSLKWFNRRLADFGVPADKRHLVTPDHLKGLKIMVTVKIEGNFPSVVSVAQFGQTSGVSAPTAPAAPASPTAAPAVATAAPAPAPAAVPAAAAPSEPVAAPAGVNALSDANNPFAGMQ
jgi:hypothetical protein